MTFLDRVANVYVPVDGGWKIWLTDNAKAKQSADSSEIGIVSPLPEQINWRGESESSSLADDARLHRRPLFPPADRKLIWNNEQLAKIPRTTFRPIALAYNASRNDSSSSITSTRVTYLIPPLE